MNASAASPLSKAGDPLATRRVGVSQGGAPVQRRLLLTALPVLALAGCGFQLRQAPNFAFRTIYVLVAPASALGVELKRSIASADHVQVLTDPAQMGKADVIMEVLTDTREKVVVGVSASGQVREFQLRVRLKFQLRTPQGKDLIPETELLQQRDFSFNETAALAKESEEASLYRSMQSDLVQQVMRRLAAVRGI